jgi:hypothetical protein
LLTSRTKTRLLRPKCPFSDFFLTNLKRLGGFEMEEYVTVKELSSRIKFSKQTIYNLICENVFVLGKHYLKPRPKKILFKWSEIEAWMGESPLLEKKTDPNEKVQPIPIKESLSFNPTKNTSASSIKI